MRLGAAGLYSRWVIDLGLGFVVKGLVASKTLGALFCGSAYNKDRSISRFYMGALLLEAPMSTHEEVW